MESRVYFNNMKERQSDVRVSVTNRITSVTYFITHFSVIVLFILASLLEESITISKCLIKT